MTEEMKAGRELDALIADKIMNDDYIVWKFFRVSQNKSQISLDGISWTEYFGYLKPYSTSIAAAWEVVEKMRSLDHYVEIASRELPHGDSWVVGIAKYGAVVNIYRDLGIAETVPLAICLASLKAMESK